MRVITTAGHVDHGKSALLRALTGMEPDRFDEEQRRGMTLDLGFVWGELPSGARAAFVDVPGHSKLVRTMLAGVGAVDMCLFVVAANAGWMPQSEEHLRILQLVGARDGVIALTKIEAVDEEVAAVARADVIERIAGTFLSGRTIVEVDSLSGRGIPLLRLALDALVHRSVDAPDHARPRLWIDRSFSIRGAGTVVTGTLAEGTLHKGEQLVVIDRRGRRRPVRVRQLQTQQEPRVVVRPGERVAANVAGIDADEVGRGGVLLRGSDWLSTTKFDARIEVLPKASVGSRGAFLAYVGTSEQPARVRVIGNADGIGSGSSGTARIWISSPLPLTPGDRFVLRDSGPSQTVAGGEVLDVDPILPVSKATPDRSVDRVVAERGTIDVERLRLLTGEQRAPTVGRWVLSQSHLNEARRTLTSAVDAAGTTGLDLAPLSELDRAILGTMKSVVTDGFTARRRHHEPSLANHPWLAALAAAPFDPPASTGIDPRVVRNFVRSGLVVEEGGVHFALEAMEHARKLVRELLERHPDGATLSQIREALGTSRKFAVPLATALDRRGITRRRGDVRVAGARIDHELRPVRI